MTRYQTIDTNTGEVVREQHSLTGVATYKRRATDSLFTEHEQDCLTWCLIGLVLGIALF